MNIKEIENKYDNQSYLRKLMYFFIDKYDLYDYVKGVNISNEFNKKNNACYNLENQEIYIYIESILKSFSYYNYYIYRINPGSKEYNYTCSSFFLENILHELTHAMQCKELDSNKKDSLHKIINDQFEYVLNNRNYKHLYEYSLLERNANINSKKLLLDLINENNLYDGKLNKSIDYNYIKLLNSKYGIICPSEMFYLLSGKISDYKKIPFNENYDTDLKKSWGMPLIKK